MNDLQTLPNLRRARYAHFGYENQFGDFKDELPSWPTYHGSKIDMTEKVLGSEELLIDRMMKVGSIDTWKAHIELHFTKHDVLVFEGDKAEKLWTAWKGIVYSSK